MVWHRMYSRTMLQAQTSRGSRTVRLLINILTASCWLLSLYLALASRLLPVLSLPLFASNWAPFDGLTAPFFNFFFDKAYSDNSGEAAFWIQCRHQYVEVIRPDFSPFEKSNTPKGQKNNKRLQSCSLAQQFSHKQSLQCLDNLQSITSSSKSTKQNCCKHFLLLFFF